MAWTPLRRDRPILESLLIKIFATALALSQVTSTPDSVKTQFNAAPVAIVARLNWRASDGGSAPCPYCHERMKPVFTIAPSEGLPEMLVLYCAPCKHVETIATTSLRPTLNQPRACRE
jgi:uncharacterized protein (UPF0212 family)